MSHHVLCGCKFCSSGQRTLNLSIEHDWNIWNINLKVINLTWNCGYSNSITWLSLGGNSKWEFLMCILGCTACRCIYFWSVWILTILIYIEKEFKMDHSMVFLGGIRPRLKRKICWQWTWSTIELVLKIENIHVKELIGIKKRNLKSIKDREGQGERTFAGVFGTSKTRTSEQRNNYWKLSLLWHEGQTESK